MNLLLFGLLMLILAARTTNVTNTYVANLALADLTGQRGLSSVGSRYFGPFSPR
jgi:purine-cytosine permease-like protein